MIVEKAMAADCCCSHTMTLDIKKSEKRYGFHVPLGASLYDTVSQVDCKCVQMFMGRPTGYECRSISDDDKRKTLEYCTCNDKTFYIHCPYTANLAKSDSSVVKSVNVISKELDIACWSSLEHVTSYR